MIGASNVPIIRRVNDSAPFPSYIPDQTQAATAVGIEYSSTKPRIISGLSLKSREEAIVASTGMVIYERSIKMRIGLGSLMTFPKSLTETPIPFISVRKAKSQVTHGLREMNADAKRRPMITPVGVSTGMKRSK